MTQSQLDFEGCVKITSRFISCDFWSSYEIAGNQMVLFSKSRISTLPFLWLWLIRIENLLFWWMNVFWWISRNVVFIKRNLQYCQTKPYVGIIKTNKYIYKIKMKRRTMSLWVSLLFLVQIGQNYNYLLNQGFTLPNTALIVKMSTYPCIWNNR